MDIEEENLTGKRVLEVGSGRGDTTRVLVTLMSKYSDTTLTVTDISDDHFPQLRSEFINQPVRIQFIQTDASALEGIAPESIDYLICNYTLCAINARVGQIIFALKRFWEVLRVGGKLFVEEEFPIDKIDNTAQEIWSDKWRILKAAITLNGDFPYNEIHPDTLAEMCRRVGFDSVKWSASTSFLPGEDSLNFFLIRLEKLLQDIPNQYLKQGLSDMANELTQQAKQVGGMEIPYYQLTARKGIIN